MKDNDKTNNSAFEAWQWGRSNPRHLKPSADYFAENPDATVRIVARHSPKNGWTNLIFYPRDGLCYELLDVEMVRLVAGPFKEGTPRKRLMAVYEWMRSTDRHASRVCVHA
ncbi:hypothetical protein [Bradyrhizobium sp. SBR1B]|uniref:hypothetical protein n=1 Tax=Bradyrhizobium sp. SBR1B TaxID=2663836 RepID=UPI00160570CA|nr:hypothetical protein [Bradyrhizobium sp. SBR1B]MBB4383566.1 hypothetical protein [Bradyrhizobium sp. SBR1B]